MCQLITSDIRQAYSVVPTRPTNELPTHAYHRPNTFLHAIEGQPMTTSPPNNHLLTATRHSATYLHPNNFHPQTRRQPCTTYDQDNSKQPATYSRLVTLKFATCLLATYYLSTAHLHPRLPFSILSVAPSSSFDSW